MQVRYLALFITDELFMRSKYFRRLFVVDLEQFLALSVGFRRNMPLPPPSFIASLLRSKSIELLEKWNIAFGIHYRQLRLGLDYLKNTLKFQFPNRLENEARLQQERRKREIKTQELLSKKFEDLKENFSSMKSEIRSTLDQLEECLHIVHIGQYRFGQNSFNADDDFNSIEFKSPSLRQIRLDSLKEGAKIHENSENRAVFSAMREFYKILVSKHLESVHNYISTLIKVDNQNNRFRDSALKDFIDIRNCIYAVKKKYEELDFQHDVNDSNEDDLWEEGKIDSQHEPQISSSCSGLNLEFADGWDSSKGKGKVPPGIFISPNRSNNKTANGRCFTVKIKGKTSDVKDLEQNKNKSEPTSIRSKLLVDAPVFDWAPSFYNWGSSKDILANHRGLELDSHWGRVDQDAVIPASKIAELNVHVSTYREPTVEIQPCLVPLKKGGLCPRRDMKACPFHGVIIPRDSNGNPIIEGKTPPNEETTGVSSKPTEDERISVTNYDDMAAKLANQAVKNIRERDNEAKLLKKAKLAKVREHNETVLREAAVTSSTHSECFGNDIPSSYRDRSEPKLKKPTLASMLKKKVTTKDRLVKKLASTRRATEGTTRQLSKAEDDAYKEAYPNQW